MPVNKEPRYKVGNADAHNFWLLLLCHLLPRAYLARRLIHKTIFKLEKSSELVSLNFKVNSENKIFRGAFWSNK